MLGDEVTIESFLTPKVAPEVALEKPEVMCRICKIFGDHWTSKCPYKGILESQNAAGASAEEPASGKPGIFVPSHRKDGGSRREADEPTVRVTNLSEETKENDVMDLFTPFGPVRRVYLAKDRQSGLTKGFAFVTFARREDAARAIQQLEGYGYDHLILHLEWARPAGY
jgi:translation initiation factor 3 subunit G